MLATTSILVKTEDGREALSARGRDLQMRQRHLLILINGARTVGQLHQLLADWSDLDDLLAGLHHAGMVDVLNPPAPVVEPVAAPIAAPTAAPTPDPAPSEATDPIDEHPASEAPFDPIAYFNQPLLDEVPDAAAELAAEEAANENIPPLSGMTLGLQKLAARLDEIEAANEPAVAPVEAPAPEPVPESVIEPVVESAAESFTEPVPVAHPATSPPPELADVLPSVVKVELMRLAKKHFGPVAATVIPLLRASGEDSQSLCGAIAASSQAASRQAGEHAAARFVDDAMRALAQRRR